jgi:tRNA(Arg) A34 adenosine deaminase TadA
MLSAAGVYITQSACNVCAPKIYRFCLQGLTCGPNSNVRLHVLSRGTAVEMCFLCPIAALLLLVRRFIFAFSKKWAKNGPKQEKCKNTFLKENVRAQTGARALFHQ